MTGNMTTVACPHCGSTETTLRRERIRYDIRRDVRECDACDLVFLWPIEPEQNKAADFYQKEQFRNMPRESLGLASHSKEQDIFQTRLGQAQRRLDGVLPHMDGHSSLLEIGCSAGSFVSLAKKHFPSVTAVELDPTFARFTRQTQNIDVLETPLEDLDPATQKYDVICMWHVLEHLANPWQTLRRLSDLLTDGGLLAIEVPNIEDPLLTRFDCKPFEAFYYQEPHLYYFSPKTLADAFAEAGWDATVSPVQIYSLWNHLNWALRGKPQKNQPAYPDPAFDLPNLAYKAWCRATGKSDTIYAIARKPRH